MERYLRVNFLGPGSRFVKKKYWPTISRRLRNTGVGVANRVFTE